MMSSKRGINVLILVLIGLLVFFISHTSAIGPLPEISSCIDNDGKGNFKVASSTEYYIKGEKTPIIRYDKCVGNTAWDYFCSSTSGSVESRNIGTITGRVTGPDDPRIGDYVTKDCEFSCLNGRCTEISPGIDLFADYSPKVSGIKFFDVVYISCQAASVNNVNEMVLTIKGYDAFDQLWINHQETFVCGGGTCYISEWIDGSDESLIKFPDFSKTIPGRYEVTCSSTDGQGNSNSKTKNFQTSCDTVCQDTAPPFIQEFSLTELASGIIWVELKALDAVSGTDFMTLTVENSPLSNDEWEKVSEEIFQCTQLECLRYKLHTGRPGDWKATVQVFDKEGNVASLGTQDTKALSTGVSEPPAEEEPPIEEPLPGVIEEETTTVEEPVEEIPIIEEPIEEEPKIKKAESIKKLDRDIAFNPPGEGNRLEKILGGLLDYIKRLF